MRFGILPYTKILAALVKTVKDSITARYFRLACGKIC